MKVKHMRKVDKGFLKAFFSVETESLDINDMKLMEGRDGNLYADEPSKEYVQNGQKKYSKVIYIKKRELKDQITELAREAYFGEKPEPEDVPW